VFASDAKAKNRSACCRSCIEPPRTKASSLIEHKPATDAQATISDLVRFEISMRSVSSRSFDIQRENDR